MASVPSSFDAVRGPTQIVVTAALLLAGCAQPSPDGDVGGSVQGPSPVSNALANETKFEDFRNLNWTEFHRTGGTNTRGTFAISCDTRAECGNCVTYAAEAYNIHRGMVIVQWNSTPLAPVLELNVHYADRDKEVF